MINKVTLIGNLGNDPEIRRLENGTMVGRFSLATNESYKDKDGNFQTTTEWHNVIVWRDLAEKAEKSLKKGTMCYVEGKIKYRKYTGTDGVERNVTDIEALTYRLLERREGGGSGSYTESRFPGAESTNARSGGGDNVEMVVTNDAPPPPAAGDDLPF
jgi:single-strand DNA-binding protein